jgi:hypothetical protein
MSDAPALEPGAEANAPVQPDPAPQADPAPEPKPEATTPASVLEADPKAQPEPVAPQDWPDDWRQKMAGEDEKALKQLERVKSPADLLKRYTDAQKKISQGVKPLTIDEKSSEEDIAAYRKAVGIPEDVKDYEITFSENMQPTDADKQVLSDFKQAAFDKNIPPDQAQSMLDWYEVSMEAQAQDMAEHAENFRTETTEALRQEWGGEYQSNLNAIKTYLESNLGENYTELAHKQFTDGTFLGDDPNFLRMMAGPATDHVGPNAIFSGDVETATKSLEERKAELLKLRGGTRDEKVKYKSEEVQSELSDIYAKLEKAKTIKR